MDNVVLPVADLTVALYLLGLVVGIVYVEPCVVREVPKSHLIETLKEHMVS